MYTIAPGDTSFLTFTNLLTGYRLSALLRSAHDAGVFQIIGPGGAGIESICRETGWAQNTATRFLRTLCEIGLVKTENEVYRLTPFSSTYLLPDSSQYQGKTLAFEKRLVQSWECLTKTMAAGRRVHETVDKNEEELEKAYADYLGAMDEAAGIRALELWDSIVPRNNGTILEIGAGSGRFLKEFLTRHGGWQAIFCDLPNVVAKAAEDSTLSSLKNRIRFLPCNYLDPVQADMEAVADRSCSLVLLSNVVHCQGKEETMILLSTAAKKTSADGLLLIHDFFTDTACYGPMYDVHMLLNTYNGRTYSQHELAEMAASCGFNHTARRPLASGSELIAFAPAEKNLSEIL